MAEKKILVACGTALATSTVVARTLEKELGSRGISVVTEQCRAVDVPQRVEGFDLVVTTTFVADTAGVPVVHSVSFLTGIGLERDIEAIVKHLGF